MRAVVQRVSTASVHVDGELRGQIGLGLLVLLGVETADEATDVAWLAGKVARLRIFGDGEGQMNQSVSDLSGGLLVISQFTLFASTKKGNRPGFIRAARPEVAEPLYEAFVAALARLTGLPVATGVFGAEMKVSLLNDGPVTIFIDTANKE